MKSPEQIFAFIKKQKVAFIASVDDGGFPNLKAMLPPRKIEAPRLFYFSTNTSSLRVAQYRNNPRAGIYFYHKGLLSYEGVMLLGEMEVREDPALKEELWGPMDRLYYPKGVNDPDYCILVFTAREGRYYRDLKTESFFL